MYQALAQQISVLHHPLASQTLLGGPPMGHRVVTSVLHAVRTPSIASILQHVGRKRATMIGTFWCLTRCGYLNFAQP